MIVITTKDKNLIEHMLESLNKTEIKVDESENINLSTIQDNNTINDTQTNTQKKTKSSSKNTKSKKADSDTWGDYEDDTYVYGHGAGSMQILT